MKKNKGAVLTGVILMVLVMTLIGVPLLGMVIYNYKLRDMDNSIKSAEYENEIAMDKISIIIRNTLVSAINSGRDEATKVVNEIVDSQRANWSSIYDRCSSEWNNAYAEYMNGARDSATMKIVSGGNPASSEEYKDPEKAEVAKENYIKSAVAEQYSEIMDEENIEYDIAELVDTTTGQPDEAKLQNAYNEVFKKQYEVFVSDNIINEIEKQNEYASLVADTEDVLFGELDTEKIKGKENYLVVTVSPLEAWSLEKKLNVNVKTVFRKNAMTPVTTLSATFVISTPEFNSVSSISTTTVTLSNPLLNHALIVGKKLEVAKDKTLNINGDTTVMGTDVEEDATGKIVSVLVNEGASLIMDNDASHKSKFATGNDILLKISSSFNSGKSPLYYRNLYLGETTTDNGNSINVNFQGDAVAKDDLEINAKSGVVITQKSGAKYYGYNDLNDTGPDSSSSIVINSGSVTNKQITLGDVYLAGRAFIEGVTDSKGNIYKTGESIAVKGNYIAYQTPLANDTDLRADKVKFSTYFMGSALTADRKNAPLNLVDYFLTLPTKDTTLINNFSNPSLTEAEKRSNFDTMCKWKYFKQYSQENPTLTLIPKVEGTFKYLEGVGFNKKAGTTDKYEVIGSTSKNGTAQDTLFKSNMDEDFTKHTQYFGYAPEKNNGDGTTGIDPKAKSQIFGTTGWINSFADFNYESTEGVEPFTIILKNNSTPYTLNFTDGQSKTGMIVCTGDLNINVTGAATFNGTIICGGNLTVSGGTLTINEAKEKVVNAIINNHITSNYLGIGTDDKVFSIFKYDESGTTYIATTVGENFININNLVGITNWKKHDWGRL